MTVYRLVLVLVVGLYLLSPAIMNAWSDQGGLWYRPYLLWLIMILLTFLLQGKSDAD